jgi:hypothetical protein
LSPPDAAPDDEGKKREYEYAGESAPRCHVALSERSLGTAADYEEIHGRFESKEAMNEDNATKKRLTDLRASFCEPPRHLPPISLADCLFQQTATP